MMSAETSKWLVWTLPTVLIVLSAGAAVACLAARDWWRAVYWLSAASLNVAVTFGL